MAVYAKCSICGKIIDTQKEECKKNSANKFICSGCILKGYEWKEKD